MNTPATTLNMTAGQSARLDRENDEVKLLTETDPNVLAWKEQRLVFLQASIPDVMEDLARYYRKEFKIAVDASGMHCRLNNEFTGQSLEEVLEEMQSLLQLEYELRADTIVILSANCD